MKLGACDDSCEARGRTMSAEHVLFHHFARCAYRSRTKRARHANIVQADYWRQRLRDRGVWWIGWPTPPLEWLRERGGPS